MNKTQKYLTGMIAVILMVSLACHSSKTKEEDLSIRCCQECREAFSQSPVGIGADGAQCGAFTTAKPLSAPCSKYFKEHPTTVAACD